MFNLVWNWKSILAIMVFWESTDIIHRQKAIVKDASVWSILEVQWPFIEKTKTLSLKKMLVSIEKYACVILLNFNFDGIDYYIVRGSLSLSFANDTLQTFNAPKTNFQCPKS